MIQNISVKHFIPILSNLLDNKNPSSNCRSDRSNPKKKNTGLLDKFGKKTRTLETFTFPFKCCRSIYLIETFKRRPVI